MRVPRVDESGEGYLVVADDGSGDFQVIQVLTEKPFEAIREALPYFEEHVVGAEKVTLVAYRDEHEPDAKRVNTGKLS